jgi:hypothetical protein
LVRLGSGALSFQSRLPFFLDEILRPGHACSCLWLRARVWHQLISHVQWIWVKPSLSTLWREEHCLVLPCRGIFLSSISVRKACIFSVGACLAIRYDGVSACCSVRLGLGHVATAGLCPPALVFSLVQETTPGSGVMFICRGLASFLVHSCVRCCQTCAGLRIGLVLAFLLFLLRARSSLLVPLSSLRYGVIPAVRLLTFHFYVACS